MLKLVPPLVAFSRPHGGGVRGRWSTNPLVAQRLPRPRWRRRWTLLRSGRRPGALDGALVSDGEPCARSIRDFEALLACVLGRPKSRPSSPNAGRRIPAADRGRFNAPRVKVQDGTDINVDAVCSTSTVGNGKGSFQNPRRATSGRSSSADPPRTIRREALRKTVSTRAARPSDSAHGCDYADVTVLDVALAGLVLSPFAIMTRRPDRLQGR